MVTEIRRVPGRSAWRYHGRLASSKGPMPVDLLFAMLRNPHRPARCCLPRTLANAMAGAALGADTVIELGAGTGPVTEACCAACPACADRGRAPARAGAAARRAFRQSMCTRRRRRRSSMA